MKPSNWFRRVRSLNYTATLDYKRSLGSFGEFRDSLRGVLRLFSIEYLAGDNQTSPYFGENQYFNFKSPTQINTSIGATTRQIPDAQILIRTEMSGLFLNATIRHIRIYVVVAPNIGNAVFKIWLRPLLLICSKCYSHTLNTCTFFFLLLFIY